MTTTFDSASAPTHARAALDADAVRAAYARWVGIYDAVFGSFSAWGRRAAVAKVNGLPGQRVLEVGVGTGLALPHYAADKRVTGIDLSADMLVRARVRAAGLRTVEGLHEMDAEATSFPDAAFDISVAMFVASVVPNPRRLMAEMRRVTKPGGELLFVNHLGAQAGLRWWLERAAAPASRLLGWHTDFRLDALLAPEEIARASLQPTPPFGNFTLIHLRNQPSAPHGADVAATVGP